MMAHRLTLCPVCDRPMRLAAVTPRSGGLPAVQTFECRICCVALTAAQDQPFPLAAAADAVPARPLELLTR
jgi:hypothetical protein